MDEEIKKEAFELAKMIKENIEAFNEKSSYDFIIAPSYEIATHLQDVWRETKNNAIPIYDGRLLLGITKFRGTGFISFSE